MTTEAAARKRAEEWGEEYPPAKRSKVGKVWEYVCKSGLVLTSQENTHNSWATVKSQSTNLSVFGRDVNVLVTCEADLIENWIARQQGTVFGLDLEWKPNRVRGQEENKTALIQICNQQECLIVQMLFLDRIPRSLVNFLKDSNKLLGGVGVTKDADKLRRDYNLDCQGTVELGRLAVEKLGDEGLRGIGLRALAQNVIGLTMDKPKRVTMSNWAKRNLDTAQVNYACVDAWVSYAILDKLLTTCKATSEVEG